MQTSTQRRKYCTRLMHMCPQGGIRLPFASLHRKAQVRQCMWLSRCLVDRCSVDMDVFRAGPHCLCTPCSPAQTRLAADALHTGAAGPTSHPTPHLCHRRPVKSGLRQLKHPKWLPRQRVQPRSRGFELFDDGFFLMPSLPGFGGASSAALGRFSVPVHSAALGRFSVAGFSGRPALRRAGFFCGFAGESSLLTSSRSQPLPPPWPKAVLSISATMSVAERLSLPPPCPPS